MSKSHLRHDQPLQNSLKNPSCHRKTQSHFGNSRRPTALYPQRAGPGVTGADQVSRCLTLASQNQEAAVAFFSRLHENAGVPSAAKMIAMLVKCALAAARGKSEEAEEPFDGVPQQRAASKALKGKRKGGGTVTGKSGPDGNPAGGQPLTASNSQARTHSGVGRGVVSSCALIVVSCHVYTQASAHSVSSSGGFASGR